MPPRKKATAPRTALESAPQNSTNKRSLEENPQDAPKAKRTRAPKATIEDLPDWAYDVAGTWEIDAENLSHDFLGFEREYPGDPPPFTMHIKYTNNPTHKKIGRQMWATFTWGKMEGIIRMCPGHKYRTSHLDFYDNCVLKRGVWPGPSPQGISIWNFRWRAKFGDDELFLNTGGATDEYETQLEFSRDPDGEMKLSGKIVLGGYKARKFAGIKTEQQPEPRSNEKTLKSLWDSLRDPDEESRQEICRGCKGAMDESSESETDEEIMIDWEAKWKEREAEKAREEEEEKQPWPTGISGEWEITCKNDDRDGPLPSSMNIYYEDGQTTAGRRQYYADFKMNDNWYGTMRFCPRAAVKGEFSVEDFEKGCILKDGVEAGPPPVGVHEWLVKWRGFYADPTRDEEYNKPGPTDNMTSNITFKLGENGKMVSSFVICEGMWLKFYKGVRIGDGKQRAPNDPTIEKLWEDKKFREPPPPPPPKLWPWKSPLSTPNIEAPPEWAWDVLGKWDITAPEVARSFELEKDAPMSMVIRLANDPKKKKTGRQLWATFDFGPKVSGCMRFCPLPENSRPVDTVAQFEKNCVLKKGIWPGDKLSKPDKSFQKWGYRWRAADERDDYAWRSSDTVEHMFEFKRDEDGTLKLRGVFGAIWMLCSWSAVKVEDGGSEKADVDAIWNSF